MELAVNTLTLFMLVMSLTVLLYSVDSEGNCDGIQIGVAAEINIELTLAQCTERLIAGPIQ